MQGELHKPSIDAGETTAGKYRAGRRKPPSQSWRTFLENHLTTIVSAGFFAVTASRFQVLYVVLALARDRRRIVPFNAASHPTAE